MERKMKCLLFTLLLSSILTLRYISLGDVLVIGKNDKTKEIPVAQTQKIRLINNTANQEQKNRSYEMELKRNFLNPNAEQKSIEFEFSPARRVVKYISNNQGKFIQKSERNIIQTGKNSPQRNFHEKVILTIRE